jgi:hypothetical protein
VKLITTLFFYLLITIKLQIILQAILSLLVAVLGVTSGIAGEFKEIRANIDLQKK